MISLPGCVPNNCHAMSGIIDIIKAKIFERARRNEGVHGKAVMVKIRPESDEAGDYDIIER